MIKCHAQSTVDRLLHHCGFFEATVGGVIAMRISQLAVQRDQLAQAFAGERVVTSMTNR